MGQFKKENNPLYQGFLRLDAEVVTPIASWIKVVHGSK
jgi:hypothetical protein